MLLDASESQLVLVDYQERLMPAIFEGAAVLANQGGGFGQIETVAGDQDLGAVDGAGNVLIAFGDHQAHIGIGTQAFNEFRRIDQRIVQGDF